MIRNTFLLLFFLFLFPVCVFASSDFKTDLTVTQVLDADGSSKIKELFAVTNLTSKYLVSSYEYRIVGDAPAHLSARDSFGPLVVQTQKMDDGTTSVRAIFNDVIGGKNKTMYFSFTYDGPVSGSDSGIWKVNYPKVSDFSKLDSYIYKISVPVQLGVLLSSTLDTLPESPLLSKNSSAYSFDLKADDSPSVSLFIGNFQIKKFNYQYTLINTDKRSQEFSVLLPPDYAGQKVYISSILPAPHRVYRDISGNWLAGFTLKTDQNATVYVEGQIQIPTSSSQIILQIPGSNLENKVILPTVRDTFSGDFIKSQPDISQNLRLPFQMFPNLSASAYLEVENLSSGAIYSLEPSFSSSGIVVESPGKSVSALLPFEKVRIPVSLSSGYYNLFHPKNITVFVGGSTVTYNIPQSLFFLTYGIIIITISFIAVISAFFAHRAWCVHLQKRKR